VLVGRRPGNAEATLDRWRTANPTLAGGEGLDFDRALRARRVVCQQDPPANTTTAGESQATQVDLLLRPEPELPDLGDPPLGLDAYPRSAGREPTPEALLHHRTPGVEDLAGVERDAQCDARGTAISGKEVDADRTCGRSTLERIAASSRENAQTSAQNEPSTKMGMESAHIDLSFARASSNL